MAEWVVRAGVADVATLMKGYRQHTGMPSIYGFSVQYAPGKTVIELAEAGQFPHSYISYAYESDLTSALLSQGYRMELIRSPGRGYHATFVVLYDGSGNMLMQLPLDAAQALSGVFKHMKNPQGGAHP
jgi:hypothetical protein